MSSIAMFPGNQEISQLKKEAGRGVKKERGQGGDRGSIAARRRKRRARERARGETERERERTMSSSGDDHGADPNLSLYHAIELLDGDTRQRLSAIEIIQSHVDSHALGRDELNALTDAIVLLLKDNNFKVCVGALRVASVALAQAGDHCKAMAPLLVPALIERLGDGKAAVRNATLDAVFVMIGGLHSPNVVHERFAACWRHKNNHTREGILKIAIHCLKEYGTKFTSSKKRKADLIKDIVHLLGDSSSAVRETAMSCVEAAYFVMGKGLRSALKEHGIRSAHMKEINSRLDLIQPDPEAGSSTATRAQSESPTSLGKSKRGGFKDGGGMTSDGTISSVSPIHIKSSHELQNVLDDIKGGLMDTTENWQARMEYMIKLEGIILGNAKKFDILVHSLNHMKTCFIEQVLDRRSAVSRQACQLLTMISENFGSAVDSIVEHLVPSLFKVVVISVQVQADAAHTAVKKMMRECHVGKLVTQISNNLQQSRNAKLRCACIDYFHVILESWLKPEYDHYVAHFEAGLKCALSDASKDVRARARETFVMYKAEWPENAAALFEGLSSSVQKAIAQTGKKKKTARNARPSIRSQVLKADFAAQLADSEADGDLNAPIIWAKRENHAASHDTSNGSGTSSEAEAKANPSGKHPKTSMVGGAMRLPADAPAKHQDKGRHARKRPESAGTSAKANNHPGPAGSSGGSFSFKSYLATATSRTLSWNDKVEKNAHFLEWVTADGHGIVSEVAGEVEKLVFIFVEQLHDPHHKVALSSLSLFGALLPLCLHMLEPYTAKFLPPLFLKMVDTKEQVRARASEILMTIGERYGVETLIPALTRSLKSNKHPRSRIAALEFSVKYFRKRSAASSAMVEGWVALIGPLICEKVVEVRRAAAAALVRVYQSVDADPVLAHILALAPRDQSMVRKAVHSFVGSIDEELAAYAASKNIHNLCWLNKASEEVKEKAVAETEEAIEPEDSKSPPKSVTKDRENGGAGEARRETTSSYASPKYQRQADSIDDSAGDHATSYKSRDKGVNRTAFALREKSHNMETAIRDAESVEMHDLEVILADLGKCNLKQDYALKQFSTLARKYPTSVWEVFADGAVSKLLAYATSSVSGVKACALLSIKEFACHQGELLSDSIDAVVSIVLGAVGEAHLEVKQSADECLMALANGSPDLDYLVELLLDHLSAHEAKSGVEKTNARLVSIFRALGKAVSHFPQAKAGHRLGEVLPYLFASFNSPDADVRKSVVFCLVDIYSVMGNALMPHLSALSAGQLKLLTIYIQRREDKRRSNRGSDQGLGKENIVL